MDPAAASLDDGGDNDSDDERASSASSSAYSSSSDPLNAATPPPTTTKSPQGKGKTSYRETSHFCIGEIEPELHQNYAAIRRPSIDNPSTCGGSNSASNVYLHAQYAPHFQALDAYCDASNAISAASGAPPRAFPFVLYGVSGAGKSALLSNWLLHHQRKRQEDNPLRAPTTSLASAFTAVNKTSTSTTTTTTTSMISLSPSSPSRVTLFEKEEFIFWHVAGCSRSSILTIQLLRRLETELKHHFDLKKEVPKDDARLRWELPNFLELAAAKAASQRLLILIVIDGLHRMRDEEGKEDLKWLPQSYPANVRLIVSTSVYASGNSSSSGVGVGAMIGTEQQDKELHLSLTRHTAAGDGSISVGIVGSETAGAVSSLVFGGGETAAATEGMMNLNLAKTASMGFKSFSLERDAQTTAGTPKQLGSTGGGGGNKTFYEVRRRGWNLLKVDEMTLQTCQELLLSCVTVAGAAAATQNYNSNSSNLVLFPSQCQSLLASSSSSSSSSLVHSSRNPLFLRLLLHALRWSAESNMDLWQLFSLWTRGRSSSLAELYDRILDSWEHGLLTSSESREEAQRHAARETSNSSFSPNQLKQQHGERQQLYQQQQQQQRNGSASLTHDFSATGARRSSEQQDVPDELPLSEIQWRKVHADADKAIEDARVAVERAAARAMAEGMEAVSAQLRRTSSTASSFSSSSSSSSSSFSHHPPIFRNEALIDFFVNRKPTTQEPPRAKAAGAAGGGSLRPSMVSGAELPFSLVVKEPLDEQQQQHSTGPSPPPPAEPAAKAAEFPQVPTYLCGGEDFEGLGNLLGNALAVLYVARHGLTVDELRHLLASFREREDSQLCTMLWKHKDVLLALFQAVDEQGHGVLGRGDFEALVLHVSLEKAQQDQTLALMKRYDLRRLVQRSRACALENENVIMYRIFLDYCGGTTAAVAAAATAKPFSSCASSSSTPLSPSSFRLRHAYAQQPAALEEELVQKLLQVLRTLGVLLLRNDRILVLTLASEELRGAVERRYIQRHPSGEQIWHQSIVQYFQSQPSSLLRRCEELPWHLRICQEWKALKSFVAELGAMETMYQGVLKGELFEYWRLLTEGPLWLPAVAAAEGDNPGPDTSYVLVNDDDEDEGVGLERRSRREQRQQQQQQQQQHQHQQRSLPFPSSSHASATAAFMTGRKKIPPYDIVECYNHSVEQWKANAAAKPSTQQLAKMLWLVGRFLAEFADAVTFKIPFPRYLRKPLDLALMEMLGMETKENESLSSKIFLKPLPPVVKGAGKGNGGGNDDDDDDDDESDQNNEEEEGDKEGGNGNAADGDQSILPAEEEDAIGESNQSRRRHRQQLEHLRSAPSLIAMDSSFYYFKRWIWIQFPWIALANVDLALRLFLEEEEILAERAFRPFLLGGGVGDATADAATTISAGVEMEEGEEDASSVDMFSTDQSKANNGSASGSPGRRGGNGCDGGGGGRCRPAGQSSSLAAAVADRTWLIKKADPTQVRAVDPQSVEFRTMVRSSALRLAPHAEHAGRLVKAIYHDDPKLLMKHGDEAYLPQSEDEDSIVDESSLLQSQSMFMVSGLTVTRQEKHLQDSGKRVARLRAIFDRVANERSQMESQLDALERMATARNRQDEQILQAIETGEFFMQALQMRLGRLLEALSQAHALSHYYGRIINQCLIKNPVKDTKRLESLDKHLALATAQCQSLTNQWRLVKVEKERLETDEVAKVERRLHRLAAERVKIRHRIALLQKQQRQAQQQPSSHYMSALKTSLVFMKLAHAGGGGGGNNQRQQQQKQIDPFASSLSGGGAKLLSVAHEAAAAAASATSSSSTLSPSKKLTAYQSIFAAKRAERIRLGMEKLFEMSGVQQQQTSSAEKQQQQQEEQEEAGKNKCSTSTLPLLPLETEAAVQQVIHVFKKVHKSTKAFTQESQALEARLQFLRSQLQLQEQKSIASNLEPTTTTTVTRSTSTATATSYAVAAAEAAPSLSLSPSSLAAFSTSTISEDEQRCVKYQQLHLGAQQLLEQLKTGVNHLARLVTRHSTSLPLASLRSKDGDYQDQYEDADLYKMFCLFDERIMSIQEIVVLEANEKADGAIKTFAGADDDRQHHRQQHLQQQHQPRSYLGGHGQDITNTYEDILASIGMADDNNCSSSSSSRRRRGDRSTTARAASSSSAGGDSSSPGVAGLMGIGTDMVMQMKADAQRTERRPTAFGGAYHQGLWLAQGGGSEDLPPSLRTMADRHKIRIHAFGAMEDLYNSKIKESRKREDESMEQMEKEARRQVVVTGTEETDAFFRHALVYDSPTHLRMRQVMKHETDVKARQYDHLEEAQGLAIDQALQVADTSMKKILGWEKTGRTTTTPTSRTRSTRASGTAAMKPNTADSADTTRKSTPANQQQQQQQQKRGSKARNSLHT